MSAVIPIREHFKSSQEPEPYIPPEKAAEFLGLPRRAVIRMARDGRLPAHPIKGTGKKRYWRFRLSELDKHMQGDVQPSRPPVRN
jgi:excisionase family DNA binding protein